MDGRAWTVGYQGLSVEALLSALKKRRIATLVDVREQPVSRKAGFSKGALSKALEKEGLTYVHMGALGTPAATRQAFHSDGDFAALRRAYLAHLQAQEQAMERLRALIGQGRRALLCFEREASQCHRAILCKELEKEGYAFTHLRPARLARPARSSGAKLSDFS